MDISMLNSYAAVSLVIVVFTIWAIARIWKLGAAGKCLSVAGIWAIVSVVSYFVRVMSGSVSVFSWMTTVHLISIDFALYFFAAYILYYTEFKEVKKVEIAKKIFQVVIAIDVVALLINPFFNVVVDFVFRDPVPLYSKITYGSEHFLYFMHISIAYALIASVLALVSVRICLTPKEFRKQYTTTLVALSIILLANFCSVFIYGNRGYLNYSVTAYCLMFDFMYLFVYRLSKYIMLAYYKDSVFENVDQAIVLFDYNDRLLIKNTKAMKLLSNVNFERGLMRPKFEELCNVALGSETDLDIAMVQNFVSTPFGELPCRCDFRRMKNTDGQLLGYLYVFSDIGFETDSLTGFHNWSGFKNFAEENLNRFTTPLTVVVADINNLSTINSVSGRDKGDQILKSFAEVLKKTFSGNSYFVRGENAELIVICLDMSFALISEKMDYVQADFSGHFLYVVQQTDDGRTDILAAVENAEKTLRQKKMLNSKSKHSEILNAMKKMLREYNSDADAQVKRMQLICQKLGERVGLVDNQPSELQLLCVLHDVGNIGIPREILNKPDKLTPEEWKKVQTHPARGSQIAKSSKNFAAVADAILHHHERWDGNGYPDGLRCESIPLLSRIFAVVDSYDAMTHKRSFRPAMSKDVAIAELRACAGTQFDSSIVADFLAVLKKLENDPEYVELEKNEKEGKVDSGEFTLNAMASSNGGLGGEKLSERHVHSIRYSRYILDAKNNVVSVDNMFEVMTGYSREHIREYGLSQMDLIPQEDQTEYLCLLSETIANNPIAYFEHRMRCKNDTNIYVFCIGKLFYDSAARETRTEIIIHDCSNTYAMKMLAMDEKAKGEKQRQSWENMYRKDALTGLLTRSAFQSDVEEKLLDDNVRVMFLMIDVDEFKQYNDTFGHRAGDNFLVLVSQTIQSALRGSDLACRMGGDEFAAALFFKRECQTEFMCKRAQQIYEKVASMIVKENDKGSISMGAAIAENKDESFVQLYESADRALYNSKNEGRGRLSIGNAVNQ